MSSDSRATLFECRHRNVTEATNGREDRRDDRFTHWLCLDCGDRFPLIGDTDLWEPRRIEQHDADGNVVWRAE